MHTTGPTGLRNKMIEKCFKCDGAGSTLRYIYPVEISVWNTLPTSVESVECTRCKGAGAVDYRVVKAVPPKRAKCKPT